MNLRVFTNAQGHLLVEISHPLVSHRRMWLVPLLKPGETGIKEKEDDLVFVRFSDEAYEVPVLEIRVLVPPAPEMKFVGTLEENYSRDILNNVRDLLAWD